MTTPRTDGARPLVELLLWEGKLPRAAIARQAGCSRQCVTQVAQATGYPPVHNPAQCTRCGVAIRRQDTGHYLHLCPKCFLGNKPRRQLFTCQSCGKVYSRHERYVQRLAETGQTPRACSRKCNGKLLHTFKDGAGDLTSQRIGVYLYP